MFLNRFLTNENENDTPYCVLRFAIAFYEQQNILAILKVISCKHPLPLCQEILSLLLFLNKMLFSI